ncbi:glycosyltransferase 87 family protein [Streptomyces yunnanensis]|uniref:Glycosyltransferase 87 family protein n=1 Tax=Streptomyces yunnanensis TaxID=156453 RepID=A0ABY8ADD7_9ACTN|nr:glycosyltransferase 87 family protein [Streptomyces yunnanensis]WEB43025.1 glycosyltransferase 87 family protein [Streptomyces yunnanensis]
MTGTGTGSGTAAAWTAWAATRALLLLCVFRVLVLPGPDVTTDVSEIYHGWSEVLRSGTFPLDDVTWQYPPAAALPVLAPGLLPFLPYTTAFTVLVLAVDAAALALFLRVGRAPGHRRTGAWAWIAGVALLGPTAYARYDLMVAAVAAAALLAAARRPRAAGALIALGALLKVWPVLLLTGAPLRGRRARALWGSAAGWAAGLMLAAVVAAPGALSFLTFQRDRGTEVESLGALVLHLARHAGWPGEVQLHYGSLEFLGPGVPLVSALSLALTGAALAWLVHWRLRAGPFGERAEYGERAEPAPATLCDAAFTAVLLFTTTSRVISPQYLLWLVGLAAVCLTVRASRQGPPAVLVLLAAGVTQLEFPVSFADVVASDARGIALLVLRNGLLVAACLAACRRLRAHTGPGRAAVPGPVARPSLSSARGAHTRATSR